MSGRRAKRRRRALRQLAAFHPVLAYVLGLGPERPLDRGLKSRYTVPVTQLQGGRGKSMPYYEPVNYKLRVCEHCQVTFSAPKVSARYCSDQCRIYAWRERVRTSKPT